MQNNGMGQAMDSQDASKMFCTGCGAETSGGFCTSCGRNNGATPAEGPHAAVAPPAPGNSMMRQQMMANQQAQNNAMFASTAGGNQPNIFNNNNNNNQNNNQNNNNVYANTGGGDADCCSAVDSPAWTGTDGHARPIHTALLLFACVGLILDIAMFFLHSFYSSPLGAIMGGIACVFAMVGASVFLGTSCGDRCLRNPTGAQAIFWLLGISLALSLAAVIVAAVDLATIVCKTYKDYSYNSYGYSSSSSSSSSSCSSPPCYTYRTSCYGGNTLVDGAIIAWHLLLGLFTALGMWKTLPATNNMVCCSGNAGGAHAYA